MPDAVAFPRPLTPGAYLKACRCRAGQSVHDVARALQTIPHWAEHARADWIEQIEADVVPATFNTIAALGTVVSFDLRVLERCALIQLGVDLPPLYLCRICAIERGVVPFAAPDLCSSCAGPTPAEAVAA